MKHNGSQPKPLIHIQNLSKSYHHDCVTCHVLDQVELSVCAGDFLVLLGTSGSGKSTLLNLISGIDQADTGTITISGVDITGLNEYKRTVFRRDNIGIVFQFFNLIPTLTILENITLPLELKGEKRRKSETHAHTLLDRVGLGDRAHDFPDKLSGGEQQRVAIARALVHEPRLVLADEPTGNLDEDTGNNVLTLLLELTREAGKTLIMATHDPSVVPMADQVYRIHDGKLVSTPLQPITS
jgi:putative ABC transport system ATP-binding protein